MDNQNQSNNQTVVECCAWCGKQFAPGDKVVCDELLTGIFDYKYCSNQCLEDHINSK
jgi:hypothetical protein